MLYERVLNRENRRPPVAGERGLTLLQLLLVVTLIVMLAAIVLSSLSAAREQGRRVGCLSNLRQLGMAMILYTSENGGTLPPYLYNMQPLGDGSYVMSIRSPWTLDAVGPGATLPLMSCPSDRKPITVNTTDASGSALKLNASYGYNFTLFMQDIRTMNIHFAQTALLYDADPNAVAAKVWWGTPTGQPGSDGKVLICHNGNALHVDPSAIGGNPGGHAPGPPGHVLCYLGPCGGTAAFDLNQLNQQGAGAFVRRHFNKANVLFLDGHGELLENLPGSALGP